MRTFIPKFAIIFLLFTSIANASNHVPSYDRGVKFATQGEFEKSKIEFEKALQNSPNYGQAGRSLEIVNDAIQGKIKKSSAKHIFEATYYSKFGPWEQAVVEYNKAININPNYPIAYNGRGTVLAQLKESKRAIGDYTKAISLDPQYAVAYYNRGISYQESRQFDQAVVDFDRAIAINPLYVEAFLNRGNAYLAKNQLDKAMQDFTKAIAINPKHAEAYSNRGYIFLVKLRKKTFGCSDWKMACELGLCRNYNTAKKKGDCS